MAPSPSRRLGECAASAEVIRRASMPLAKAPVNRPRPRPMVISSSTTELSCRPFPVAKPLYRELIVPFATHRAEQYHYGGTRLLHLPRIRVMNATSINFLGIFLNRIW